MTILKHQDGWRKSSFSNTGNGCIEVARTLAAVRDSKHPAGPALSVDVSRFIGAVKAARARSLFGAR